MAQQKTQKQTVVQIDPELHRRLKELAARKTTSMQALVESALKRVYKQLESEAA